MATLGTMVTRRLADRRLDHEWPAELKALWHTARHLSDAAATLEDVIGKGPCFQPADFFDDTAHSGELVRFGAQQAAFDYVIEAIRRVEALAAPLMREH